MSNIIECLRPLIGLSERPCNCYGERPEGVDVSLSGFFLDDPFDGIPLKFADVALECQDSLWQVMAEARDAAIREFYQEFTVAFANTKTPTINQFVGELGEGETKGKINKLLTTGYPVAAVELKPRIRYRGAQMTLRHIGLYINQTVNVTVSVRRKDDPMTVIHTETVPAEANKKTVMQLANPLVLPLTDSGTGKPITYLLTYDLAPGMRPWNVLWNCHCGGSERPWKQFIDPAGLMGSDVMNLSVKDTAHTNGLYVGVSVGCRSDAWLCDATLPGLVDDDFTIVMAKAIQLMAIRNVLRYAVKTDKVSYWTMLIEERAPAERARIEKAITWRMDYLTHNVPSWVSDCYMCASKEIRKGAIIV